MLLKDPLKETTLPSLHYDAIIPVRGNLTSGAIVVFIFIKVAEATIYPFLACAPIGASKLSYFKPPRTGTT